MKIPVMRAIGLKRVTIEKFAQKVLKDFCPESLDGLLPLDIEQMFEQYVPKKFGVATGYEEMLPGIHGYTDPNKLVSKVSSDLLDAEDVPTIRFGRSTIGHEIGHVMLHAKQFNRKNADLRFLHDNNHLKPLLFRQEELRPFENPEWQAWEFCKSLFLPAPLMYKAVEDKLEVKEISDIVNLNPAFVQVRLRNLGLS